MKPVLTDPVLPNGWVSASPEGNGFFHQANHLVFRYGLGWGYWKTRHQIQKVALPLEEAMAASLAPCEDSECLECRKPVTSKPTLPWEHKKPGTKLRYYEVHLFDCHLFITPHGWDAYYNPTTLPSYTLQIRRQQLRHGSFVGVALPSVEECMIQAEAAARTSMEPSRERDGDRQSTLTFLVVVSTLYGFT